MKYTLLRDSQGIQPDSVTLQQDDISTTFEAGCGNRFDVEFQAWLAEGNEPEIQFTGTPLLSPSIDDRLEALELLMQMVFEETA
jgi:hypothetical protein